MTVSSMGTMEVLLTMTEEAGMEGAFGLKAGWLQADILINTDSEEEGEIYMGCAGGVDFTTTFDLLREPLPQGYQTFTLTLKGLKGGHSGGDVHLGLGNANKLLARFLAGHAEDLSLKLLEFRGGTVRNAIPREAHAIISVPTEKVAELTALRERYEGILKNELAVIEPNLVLLLDETQSDLKALSDDCQKRFTFFLNAAPNGVIRMSDVAVGVVETSLNEGVVRMTEDQAEVIFLVRSLIDSGKNYVVNMLTSISKLAQAQYRAEGSYPGWQPDADSAVMHLVSETYNKLFGKIPNVMVIHAYFECGLFKKPYPDMDMVSIGTNHSWCSLS